MKTGWKEPKGASHAASQLPLVSPKVIFALTFMSWQLTTEQQQVFQRKLTWNENFFTLAKVTEKSYFAGGQFFEIS